MTNVEEFKGQGKGKMKKALSSKTGKLIVYVVIGLVALAIAAWVSGIWAGIQDGPDTGARLIVYHPEQTIQIGEEKLSVSEVSAVIVVPAACYDNVDDCLARAKYVCDANGLTREGHGGVSTHMFSKFAATCTFECEDHTKGKCGPESASIPVLQQE